MSGPARAAGALAKLDDWLSAMRGSPETFGSRATRVGEQFMAAAEHPGTFERGRPFADDVEGLARQFGVGPRRSIEDPELSAIFGERYWAANPEDPASRSRLYEKSYDYDELVRGSPSEAVRQAAIAKLLPHGGDFRVYDTATLDPGSRAGSRLYPAAYGALRLRPRDYNVTEALSRDNQMRRSFHQAAALMRDPSMEGRVITAPSQLSQVPLSIGELHRMPPTQQVGALQMAGGAQALAQLKSKLQNNVSKLADSALEPGVRRRLEFETEQLSMAIERLTPQPGPLRTLASVNRQAMASPMVPLGERGARRIGLTMRALQGDPSFEDLALGLEYRRGGPVRAT